MLPMRAFLRKAFRRTLTLLQFQNSSPFRPNLSPGKINFKKTTSLPSGAGGKERDKLRLRAFLFASVRQPPRDNRKRQPQETTARDNPQGTTHKDKPPRDNPQETTARDNRKRQPPRDNPQG
ncbi:hypothetical protein P40081_02900 [Paenibacillus sp. FSL P4-0081]|nr:hypothetical protein P40081_02900 [Paenibacillus sp. FSL P4-0081]